MIKRTCLTVLDRTSVLKTVDFHFKFESSFLRSQSQNALTDLQVNKISNWQKSAIKRALKNIYKRIRNPVWRSTAVITVEPQNNTEPLRKSKGTMAWWLNRRAFPANSHANKPPFKISFVKIDHKFVYVCIYIRPINFEADIQSIRLRRYCQGN